MLENELLPVINVNFSLCTRGKNSKPFEPRYDCAQQQYIEVASSYLWDYLRKSKAGGFFLPVDMDNNSCCVAICVYYLCLKIFQQITFKNNEFVLKTLRTITNDPNFTPKSPNDIC